MLFCRVSTYQHPVMSPVQYFGRWTHIRSAAALVLEITSRRQLLSNNVDVSELQKEPKNKAALITVCQKGAASHVKVKRKKKKKGFQLGETRNVTKDRELRQGLTDGRREKMKKKREVSENPFAFLQHSSRAVPCTEGHTSSLETQPPPHTTAQWQHDTHNGTAVRWQPRVGGRDGGGEEADRVVEGGVQNEQVAKNITVSAAIFRNAVHLFGFCQKERKRKKKVCSSSTNS